MKVKNSAKQKFFEMTRFMPPLYHSIPGEEFNIKRSQVIQWLIKNPDVLSYIFNIAQHCDGIVYDKKTGKWHGVDYANEEE